MIVAMTAALTTLRLLAFVLAMMAMMDALRWVLLVSG